jgi:hypothetical protein
VNKDYCARFTLTVAPSSVRIATRNGRS